MRHCRRETVGEMPSVIWCATGIVSWSSFFSIYASKLFEVIKTQLPHAYAYADDTQLYLWFKPDSAVGETEARFAMEQCIRAV